MFNLIYIYFRKLKTSYVLLLKMFWLLVNENYKLYATYRLVFYVYSCVDIFHRLINCSQSRKIELFDVSRY